MMEEGGEHWTQVACPSPRYGLLLTRLHEVSECTPSALQGNPVSLGDSLG